MSILINDNQINNNETSDNEDAHHLYNHGLYNLLKLPSIWYEKSMVIRYISPPLADLLKQFARELSDALGDSGIHADSSKELHRVVMERLVRKYDVNDDGSITIPKGQVDYYLYGKVSNEE